MPLEALPREILGAVSVGAVSTQGGARHASGRAQTGGVVAKPGTLGTALTFCASNGDSSKSGVALADDFAKA